MKKRSKNPQAHIEVIEGTAPEKLSSKTLLFKGKPHEKGGQDAVHNGRVINVEGNETAHVAEDGSTHIGGNLQNYITGNKFKTDFKRIGEKEGKVEAKLKKEKDRFAKLDASNPFDLARINSSLIRQKKSQDEIKGYQEEKEAYSILQQATKDFKNTHGVEQKDIGKFKDGGKLGDKVILHTTRGERIFVEEGSDFYKAQLKAKNIYPQEDGKLMLSDKWGDVGVGLSRTNSLSPKSTGLTKGQEQKVKDFAEKVQPLKTSDRDSKFAPEEAFTQERTSNKKPTAAEITPTGSGKMLSGEGMGGARGAQIREAIRIAAEEHGVPFELLDAVTVQESSYNPVAKSPKGALGFAQMIPSTGKIYGLSAEDLVNTSPEGIKKVANAMAKMYKELLVKHGGDQVKALMEYNGGPKVFEKIRSYNGWKQTNGDLGGEATGEQYLDAMEWRRMNSGMNDGSAHHVETYNYVNKILGGRDVKGETRGYPKVDVGTGKVDEPKVKPKLELPTIGGRDNINLNSDTMEAIKNQTQEKNFEAVTPEQILEKQNAIQAIANRGPEEKAEEKIAARKEEAKESFEKIDRVRATDIMPELAALFDKPSFVEGQEYQPKLKEAYQVSNQDAINQNVATLNRLAQNLDNPEAMSTLAGQLYEANQRSYADEFRQNQAVGTDIYNQNVDTLNQSLQTNMGLRDQQYVRQEQAKENASQNRKGAITSLSNKYATSRLANRTYNLDKSLHGYGYSDKTGNMEYIGPDAHVNLEGAAQSEEEKLRAQEEYDMKKKWDIRARAKEAKTSSLRGK